MEIYPFYQKMFNLLKANIIEIIYSIKSNYLPKNER